MKSPTVHLHSLSETFVLSVIELAGYDKMVKRKGHRQIIKGNRNYMCVWDRVMFVENRTDVFWTKESYKNEKEIIDM